MANNRVSNRKYFECDEYEYGGHWTYIMTRWVKGRELSIGAYISQYDIVNNRVMCAQKLRQNRVYLANLVAAYKEQLS